MIKKYCRMCKSMNLKTFLDLGFTPLADGFLNKEQLNELEVHYPLRVQICLDCGQAQLDFVVNPNELYRKNYPYLASVTKTGKEHFHSMATSICNKFKLKKGSFVVDVGSNIGVLLEGFKIHGMDVLGIDPAANIAEMANKRGIETWAEYFNSSVVIKVVGKKGKPAVITGTNVFAHIDNIDEVVQTVDKLLDDKGIFVIEAPYFADLIQKLEYDTIYHEHLSYLSVKPLVNFFKKFNMEVFDVERYPIHGGTIRVFVCRKGDYKVSNNVGKFLGLEKKEKVHSIEHLKKFEEDVRKLSQDLVELLTDLRKKGKRIIGVSAPAKGNTLLNYCRIGPEILEYLTEKIEIKVGMYSPGMHIPVVDDNKIFKDVPDYALILAWNFADEIMSNLSEFSKKGGKFIIPIPKPRIE